MDPLKNGISFPPTPSPGPPFIFLFSSWFVPALIRLRLFHSLHLQRFLFTYPHTPTTTHARVIQESPNTRHRDTRVPITMPLPFHDLYTRTHTLLLLPFTLFIVSVFLRCEPYYIFIVTCCGQVLQNVYYLHIK